MHKRRRKMVNGRLQWRFMRAFLLLTAGCLTLQTAILAFGLHRLAARLPNDGAFLAREIGGTLQLNLLVALALTSPFALWIGCRLTFRVAGPLYRFAAFLGEVERGERPADCRIREEDELQDFCELLNRATAPLRASGDENAEAEPGSPEAAPLRRSA